MTEATAFHGLRDGRMTYAYVDDPDVRSLVAHVRQDRCLDARFGILGMHCAACANRIERALRSMEGVMRCNVSLVEQRADLTFDPARVSLSSIFGHVDDLGYRPEIDTTATDAWREEYRGMLKRMGLAGIGAMQVMMFAVALYAGAFEGMETFYENLLRWSSLVVCTPIVLYSARPFFVSALSDLRALVRTSTATALGMDVPIALAIGAAYVTSVGATLAGTGEVYYDSVAMFTFFLLTARFLESNARRRLSLQVRQRSLLPAVVMRVDDAGPREVPLARLTPGARILVKPGEVIPADGTVLEGRSEIDQSLLSGEAAPVLRTVGERVFAGTTNCSQPLTLQVDALGERTRLGGIARISRRALAEKPPLVQLADIVARYFVLGLLVIAAITLTAWLWLDPSRALWVTLAVLVVSCPCALSVATPAALTAAAGALASNGFVITRGHVLEALTRITHVVFDKTGTLTLGEVELVEIRTLAQTPRAQCIRIAAALEAHAAHPIARAFASFRDPSASASDVRLHLGAGVEGIVGGARYRLGNAAFTGREHPLDEVAGFRDVYLSEGERALAVFRLRDSLRPGAPALVHALRERGLDVSLLSGDSEANCAWTARALGDIDYLAGATPESKLARIEFMQRAGARVLVVGDGLNDIPVLQRAHVSVAVSDALELVQANADAVISGNDLDVLLVALDSAWRTRQLIRQNLVWAVGYNLLMLPLAVIGWLAPWLAAIGMSTSSLVVTMNALRTRVPWKF